MVKVIWIHWITGNRRAWRCHTWNCHQKDWSQQAIFHSVTKRHSLECKNIRCGTWILNCHVENPTASVACSLAIETKLELSPVIEFPRVATRDSGTAPKTYSRNVQKSISYLTLLVVIGWINNIKLLQSIDRLNNKPSAREYLGMWNPECCHDVIRWATSKPS